MDSQRLWNNEDRLKELEDGDLKRKVIIQSVPLFVSALPVLQTLKSWTRSRFVGEVQFVI